MQLDELYKQTVGDTEPDAEMAQTFVKWLFKKGDIVGIRDRRGMSWGTVAAERDVLINNLPEALQSIYDHETEAYFCVSPLKEARAYTKAGIKKGENKCLRVLYADIDVKPGSFSSTEDAFAWLESLEAPPGAVVESGSGGLHAYWPAVQGLSQERWWAYLMSTLPEGVKIDRLLDQTRVLRLPGSIRFMSDGRQVLVKVSYRDAPIIRKARFAELTDAPFEKLEKERSEKRKVSDDLSAEVLGTGWSALVAEDAINQEMSWADILEPHGWTLHRDCGDHLQWTRPGKTGEKSATTGFPEESSAMSLFSEAPETRLLDLLDAKVRLTKFRVWLRLEHNDQIERTDSE